MERFVVLIFLACTLLVSCRGDRSQTKEVRPKEEAARTQGAVQESQDSNAVLEAGQPSSQPQQAQDLKSKVLAVIKTLNAMQDVSASKKENPLRVEGVVITNSQPKNSILKTYTPEDFFEVFNTLHAVAPGQLPKIMAENKGQLNFKWKARLIARDLMSDTQRSELDVVYNFIMKNPEGIREILYPISISMSTNFYQRDAVVLVKNFYVKISATNPGDNLSLTLVDSSYEETGNLFLHAVRPTGSVATELEQFRIIFSFKSIRLGKPVEQIAVLKMMPVKPVQNQRPFASP